jgi:solute carrier family 4 (sodium bicarbonate transporter), member 10
LQQWFTRATLLLLFIKSIEDCLFARRSWIINPGAVTYWWLIPLAVLPAILGAILVVLDQQITVVIVNRKEHKLVVRP